MKTRMDRQYDIQTDMRVRIKEVYANARHFHWESGQLNEEMKRLVFSTKDYQSLPQWRKAYLRGFNDCLWSILWEDFTWVLVGPDGVQYGPNNDAWLKQSHEYKESIRGTHVWSDKWQAGEFVPFSPLPELAAKL